MSDRSEPDESRPRTVLITLTGKDRPGVTSTLFGTLARFSVEVLDIEQIVLRRRLILGLLVSEPRDWKALRDAVHEVAAELGMTVEVDKGAGDNRSRPVGRSHVTVLGSPLRSTAVAAIAGRIADSGANIDRIERMARYPVTAIDLHVSGTAPDRLRAFLTEEAPPQRVDVARPRSPHEGGRPPGCRGGGPVRRPAAPRDAHDRDGCGLHAHPGRGHRDAR